VRQETIRRLVSIGLLVTLTAIFSTTSQYFLTLANIFTFLREASVTGILAVGVTFVIITAGIDLSTGAVAAFVAMVCANFLYYTTLPVPVMLCVGILAGALAGYLNGTLVTRIKLPDFIATLATQGIFRGLTLIIAIRVLGRISNKVITNPDFLILSGHINGLYLVTIVFFIIAIIGQLILKKTKLGVYTYAVGANRKSADLSGINSDRVKRIVFTFSGICCAIGGLFLCAKMGVATSEMGTGLEFDVIAAVVVGGCAFSGGRGDVFGSVIGALFMAVLTNGLYKYDISNAYQIIIKGAVIIIMVLFDSAYHQYMESKIQKNSKAKENQSSKAGEVAAL
jgi:ribose/xylose/arabinose/galactoside ABC-type transport system permease subunit